MRDQIKIVLINFLNTADFKTLGKPEKCLRNISSIPLGAELVWREKKKKREKRKTERY